MKSACEKWQEPLLEAALSGTMPAQLAEHVRMCPHCSAEWKSLEARSGRLAELLPMVAQGAEPSPQFRAKVLAAVGGAPKKVGGRWRMLVLTGAAAAALVVLVVTNSGKRGVSPGPGLSQEELAAAQKLAQWRAPSDGLLATPGQEMLRTVPKLGRSYLDVPKKKNREE